MREIEKRASGLSWRDANSSAESSANVAKIQVVGAQTRRKSSSNPRTAASTLTLGSRRPSAGRQKSFSRRATNAGVPELLISKASAGGCCIAAAKDSGSFLCPHWAQKGLFGLRRAPHCAQSLAWEPATLAAFAETAGSARPPSSDLPQSLTRSATKGSSTTRKPPQNTSVSC